MWHIDNINNSIDSRKTFTCTSGARDLVINRDLMERPGHDSSLMIILALLLHALTYH